MLKQYLSIFFLSLSTLMMLAHGIVPHQHFEGGSHHHQSNSHHHHHDHGHDHDSNEENGLSHLFCEFSHADNSEVFIEHSNFNTLSKQITLFLNDSHYLSFGLVSRILLESNVPTEKNLPYNFNIFLPSGLRAPPILFV
jgi:hypothetical protein